MKKGVFGLLAASVIVLGIFTLMSGCSSKPAASATAAPTASPPISPAPDIQSAAGPIVENILLSLNNNDYAAFSKNLDQTAKGVLTQTSFNQLYSLVKSTIGSYQSIEFISATAQGNTTTIQYIAYYSSEPANVSVNVVLQPINGILYVSGLNLNSPRLQGKPLDVGQVRIFADPETENLLISLNQNDYAGFTKDLNQSMQAVESKTTFDQTYNLVKGNVGNYVSKEFGALTLQNNFTVIRYLAKYTDEPAGVWVTISFDNNNKVGGLFFDSPRLRAAQAK
jgi:hypothetical protein